MARRKGSQDTILGDGIGEGPRCLVQIWFFIFVKVFLYWFTEMYPVKGHGREEERTEREPVLEY